MKKVIINKIILFSLLVIILITITFAACKKSTSTEKIKSIDELEIEPVKEIPYNMVVSNDIIRELGFMFTRTRSNKAIVLIKPGTNPLTYTPTQEDEKAVLEADVFLYMGLGLEPGIESMVKGIKDKVRCIPITYGLDKNLLLASKTYPEGFDPHIWWGPDVWEKFLLNMTKIFVKIDPTGEYKYSSIYLRYGEATSHMNNRFWKLWMDAIPKERKYLITLHPAYSYIERLYGIKTRSILDPFKDDYSEARINELADFIIANNVPVLFPEYSYSRKPLEELKERVAQKGYTVEIGPEIYSYFLLQDMAERNYTYLNAIRSMGRTIYDTLKIEDVPGVPD